MSVRTVRHAFLLALGMMVAKLALNASAAIDLQTSAPDLGAEMCDECSQKTAPDPKWGLHGELSWYSDEIGRAHV